MKGHLIPMNSKHLRDYTYGLHKPIFADLSSLLEVLLATRDTGGDW